MAAQEPVYSPMLVRALEGKGVRLIRPGQHHTLFLSNDGAVFSAGRPTYGRLGRRGLDAGSDEGVPSPEPVEARDGGLAGVSVVGLAAGQLLWRSRPACSLCMLKIALSSRLGSSKTFCGFGKCLR